MPETIVVGYDGSGCARAALAQAAERARRDGSTVVAVFAYEIPAAYGGETGEYRRALRELGESVAADAEELLAAAGVAHDVELVAERPSQALLDVAAGRRASLIVVGTHGGHPLAGAILGSVPHRLLHLSPVPVLVVPEPR